jgi:hypothetical protein
MYAFLDNPCPPKPNTIQEGDDMAPLQDRDMCRIATEIQSIIEFSTIQTSFEEVFQLQVFTILVTVCFPHLLELC